MYFIGETCIYSHWLCLTLQHVAYGGIDPREIKNYIYALTQYTAESADHCGE